mgnify:FL=1|tara:strand:+ start:417 stop:695 length:279 start_codon:yes stop_codon:yes gene_type:complete
MMDKKLFKVIFVLFVSLLIGVLINNSYQIHLLNNKNYFTLKNNKKLEGQNMILRKEIKMLNENKSYILLTARKKLGMIYDGEVVYKFIKKKK